MRQRTGKTIRDWLPEERPRDALRLSGPDTLPLSKLFAIILGTGTRGANAEDLARSLLGTFSSLRGIDAASISEIRSIAGIGLAKAAQVKAALEIGKRLCREEADSLPGHGSPGWALRYVTAYFGPSLRDAAVEAAFLIMFNRSHRRVRTLEVCKGDESGVYVDPTLIVREALRSAAHSVILVHNHPSGTGDPSEADVAVTVAVRDACALFEIRLLDHIIIGRDTDDCRSMVLEGHLSRGKPPRVCVSGHRVPT